MNEAPIRLVDSGWDRELEEAMRTEPSELLIVCPFIKKSALGGLLTHRPDDIRVITRFNLADFVIGVSDVDALGMLLDADAGIRGIRNLHAKMYLFGRSRAVITSANLTKAALTRNQELGVVADDPGFIVTCRGYFEGLWERGGPDLSRDMLANWNQTVTRHRMAGGRPDQSGELGDFGADAELAATLPTSVPTVIAAAEQAFVKFLGEGNNRAPISCSTVEVIEEAGCHWAVAYPANRRPRSVKEGAVMFIARLTDERDIRIIGRSIGMEYQDGRDDATEEDIAARPWKEYWPHYIRVHRAEFVDGTLANGVSLHELMDTLESDSFMPTQRNAALGVGNTNPRRAFMQQPAVELSLQGTSWLADRLQTAFDEHGKVPEAELNEFDWPTSQVPVES